MARLGGGRARVAAVYERSVAAAAPCVQAWDSYLAWHLARTLEDLQPLPAPSTSSSSSPPREALLSAQRARYERAVGAVGLDYGAQGVWAAWAGFERGVAGSVRGAVGVLLRACGVPLAGADALWAQLRALVAQHALPDVLPAAEAAAYAAARAAAPVEEQLRVEDDTRRALLARAQTAHAAAAALAAARAPYERVVGHRAYFHVAPVDDVYRRAWRAYLALETAHGARARVVALYERCLVACTYYPEFWVAYARYLEDSPTDTSSDTASEADDNAAEAEAEKVYRRALGVLGEGVAHGAEVVVAYAGFCEAHGRVDEARAVLVRAQQAEGQRGMACAAVAVARAELEARAGDDGAAAAVLRAATEAVRDTPARLCVWTRLCRLHAARGDVGALRAATDAMLAALPACADAWAAAVDAAEGAAVWGARAETRGAALGLARALLARMLGARAEAGPLGADARAAWWPRWRELEARAGCAETAAGVAGDADAVARADAEHRDLAQLLWVDSPAGRRALGIDTAPAN